MGTCFFAKITIRRISGYAPTAMHQATILNNGEVHYNGEYFVKKQGYHTWKISSQRLGALTRAIRKVDYFRLKDEYTSYDVTDAASCITSVELPSGLRKSIDHYHGDMSDPPKLRAFEDAIDRIARIIDYL